MGGSLILGIQGTNSAIFWCGFAAIQSPEFVKLHHFGPVSVGMLPSYWFDFWMSQMAIQHIRELQRRTRLNYSSISQTPRSIFLSSRLMLQDPWHINTKLMWSQFESLIVPWVQRTIKPCKKAWSDAAVKPGNINKIILVGGMTRMPKVADTVKSIFGREPSKGVNPDEAVAIGASIQGGVLAGEVTNLLLLDVTPLSLGL